MNTNRSILRRADRCPRTGGFALIEMLVVIAIITLLVAMLLPTLSKARAQARSTACKNHLSQIGRAMAMYLTDHNRYPPLFGKSGGVWADSSFPRSPLNSGGLWADRLYPYAPWSWTNGSWNCPTYMAEKGILGSIKDREGRTSMIALSYGYNGYGVGGVFGECPKLGLGAISPLIPGEEEVR